MKKRAVIIRLICYLLMLCAVLAWPVRQIIRYDFPKIPPQEFLFPVQESGNSGKNSSLRQGTWISALDFSGEIPEKTQEIYVTLSKSSQGTVLPLKLYESSKEIPHGIPFIRAHYRSRSQGKISFSVAFGKFRLPPRRDSSAKEFFVLVKVYPDGTFQVEDVKLNGKFLKDF